MPVFMYDWQFFKDDREESTALNEITEPPGILK